MCGVFCCVWFDVWCVGVFVVDYLIFVCDDFDGVGVLLL